MFGNSSLKRFAASIGQASAALNYPIMVQGSPSYTTGEFFLSFFYGVKQSNAVCNCLFLYSLLPH